MADQKITQLPALASAANIDVIPIVDIAGNATKKIEVQNLVPTVPTSNTIEVGTLLAAGDYGIGSDLFVTATQVVTAGECYAYGASGWISGNATSLGTSATGLLGIATSSDAADGVLIRGAVYLATDPGGAVGDNVYLSTTPGQLTTTPVASPNNVSRVVGYKLATNTIFFDPSKDWIEIS